LDKAFHKADAQTPGLKVSERHTPVIELAKEAAGSQHAWRLGLDWFG